MFFIMFYHYYYYFASDVKCMQVIPYIKPKRKTLKCVLLI